MCRISCYIFIVNVTCRLYQFIGDNVIFYSLRLEIPLILSYRISYLTKIQNSYVSDPFQKRYIMQMHTVGQINQ